MSENVMRARSFRSVRIDSFEQQAKLAQPDRCHGDVGIGGVEHVGHFAQTLGEPVDLLELDEVTRGHVVIAAKHDPEGFGIFGKTGEPGCDPAEQGAGMRRTGGSARSR